MTPEEECGETILSLTVINSSDVPLVIVYGDFNSGELEEITIQPAAAEDITAPASATVQAFLLRNESEEDDEP